MKRLPVLVVAHRRPELAALMVDALLACSSTVELEILVVVDGARDPSQEADVLHVADTFARGLRRTHHRIIRRTENLGVARSVPVACDGFFSSNEYGVVLEDDCIPSPEFIEYCAALSGIRSEFPAVGLICGTALLGDRVTSPSLCRLRTSRFSLSWGWASWRSTWMKYHLNTKGWARSPRVWGVLLEGGALRTLDWARLFSSLSSDSPWSWDYQLNLALWRNGLVAVHPSADLVENQGFGPGASNTIEEPSFRPRLADRAVRSCLVEAARNRVLDGSVDRGLDRHLERQIWSPPLSKRKV